MLKKWLAAKEDALAELEAKKVFCRQCGTKLTKSVVAYDETTGEGILGMKTCPSTWCHAAKSPWRP